MQRNMLLFLFITVLTIGFSALYAADSKTTVISAGSPATLLSRNTDYGCQIDYKISELTTQEISTRSGSYNQLSIVGYANSNRIGAPQLPLLRKLLYVPLGAEVRATLGNSRHKEYAAKELGLKNPVYPAQLSVSKSADPTQIVFTKDANAYRTDRYNEQPVVTVSEIGLMRGVRIVAIDFEPVKYNPVQNTFMIYSEAMVSVDFVGGDLRATSDLLDRTASIEFDQLYSQTLFNWKDTGRASLVRYPTGYVILAPATFNTTLASFITWKKQQGYTVTLQNIGTGAGEVANTTTAIKTYLQTLWNNATVANPAPTYALFVGDTAQLAANTGATGTHPTDLTYVRLNGTDYVPEMYYGRFSATTTTELQNIITKTITFEKTTMPSLTYLGEDVLIAGVDATYGPTHGNGQINYGTANYFNATYGITSNTYLYPASETSDAAVITNANAGRGIINYTAHGSESGWADPTFSVTDINAMTNTNEWGLMIGNCCLTNKFDYPSGPCFGEAVIRAANKGGVAYIGGTNNSYWDEDYWWGVGAKGTANGTAPAYSASALGVYDGLFRTHNEATTDWCMTAGDMIYMGNLAVTQGASTRIPYYWEIYSIMGDPSMSPYLGVPSIHNATYPSQILIGATSVTVNADPQSRVAITMGGVLYGTGIVGTSGVLNLTITPFTSVGTADIVITRQNKRTVISTISIIPNSGAYVSLASWTYADSNNNVCESNEAGRINATFTNVGSVAATGVVCTLSTTNLNIGITDNTETIATLAAGASVTINNAYAFTTANNMSDQSTALFNLAMVSGTSTWNSNFTVTVNAPALAYGNVVITDPTGNNNGRLDPGETVTVTVPLQNTGHAASVAGTGTLTCGTTGITINTGTASFGAIAASGSSSLVYSLTAAPSMTVGTVAALVFNATAGAYTAAKTENSTIGIIQEDFETGGFTSYPWTLGGTLPWTVANTGSHAGTYTAKSGAITHSQTSTMETVRNLTTAGNLTFWYSVSSESGYDYLKFYIDGVIQTSSWSGTVAWTQATFAIATGTHTLKWEYSKDSSVSSGSDCAWVDDIVFPASTSSVVYNPPRTLAAVASHAKVALTWVAPVSGTPSGYKIYRNSTLLTTVTTLNYNDTAVTNGTAYSYYVTATYASPAGESVASNTASATPVSLPPTSLVGVAGNSNVALTWVAPTAGTPSGYKVYRNSALLTTVTTLTHTDNTAVNGTAYTYYVTATYTSPTGESAASNTVSATPNVNPPQTLTGTAGNATVTINWLAPTSGTPTGYKVYRNSTLLTTVTVLTYTDTAVTNGTSYTYYVTAMYGATESAASNTVSLTPNASSTVTIGTGTTTQRQPFGMYWGYERDAALYLSSEIGTTGTVQSLAWYVGTGQTTAAPVTIRMATTTATTLTASTWATMITGATTVYNASTSFTTAGWKTITLTSPYTYSSGNLLVLIETSYGNTGATSYPNFRYSTAGTGTHQIWYQDNSAPTGTGTIDTSRPNIQLAITATAATPTLSVNPASLTFGTVYIGATGTQNFAISNIGGGTLSGNITTPTGYSVATAARNSSLLTSRSTSERNTLAYSLTAGQSQSYTVTFTPIAAQSYNGNVVITSNDTTHLTYNLATTGTGATAVFNAPTALIATAGNTTVGLSWTAPTGGAGTLSGYKVYRNSTLITPSAITGVIYNDSGLTNGTLYSYYVTAVYTTPTGESAASNTATATPSSAVPTMVTIGTGTTTNISLPIEPYYGYTYSQSIINQTEINIANKRINKIAWQYNGNSAWVNDALKVYMGHTATTTFASTTAWLPTSAMTLVYDGTISVPAAAGWVELTLTTPFVYNNTQNLVIAVDENTGGYHASADEFYCTAVTGARSIYYYSDTVNPDPAAPTTAMAIPAYIPNTRLTLEDIPSTPVFTVTPASFDYGTKYANTVTTQSFRVSNSGNGTLTISNIQISGTAYTLSGTPTLPASLTAGQYFDFNAVFAPIAAGTFPGTVTLTDNLSRVARTISLTGVCTDPTITTFPWTEAFGTWPPADWTLTGGTQSWATYTTTTSNLLAYANLWGWQTPNNAVLITPPLRPLANAQLSFKWSHQYNATYPNDAMRVSYSTDAATWTEIWYKAGTEFESNDGATSTTPGSFITADVTLPAGHAIGSFFLKFDAISGYGPDAYLDDVSVQTIVPAPTIRITPSTLAFGDVAVGTSASQTIMIENVGTLPLTGSFSTPTGYSSSSIARDSNRNTQNFTIAAGQSQSYNIYFAPTQSIAYDSNMSVTSNDPANATMQVALTGTGYIPPTITVNSTTFLANLLTGDSANQTLTIGNTGSRDLTFDIQALDTTGRRSMQQETALGSQSQPSRVTWLTCNPLTGTIPASGNQNVTLGYSAFNMAAGVYTAMLTIATNDPLNAEQIVEVTMNVTVGNHVPAISLPAEFSFDKNASLTQSFAAYVSDADNDPLTLSISGNTHVQAQITGLSVTFTADTNWIGSEVVTFTVSDGVYTANDNVTINVLPINTPVWTPVVYPNNSATVYGVVTIEGLAAAADDVVGAFAGEECRGLGTVVVQRNNAYVTMLVNLATDNEVITFKIYDASTDQILTDIQTLTLSFGEVVGDTTPHPIVVNSAPLEAPVVTITTNGTGIRLSWNPVAGANSYQVYGSFYPDHGFGLIETTAALIWDFDVTDTALFFQVVATQNTPVRN